MNQDFEKLAERLRHGDHKAFDQLYGKYHQKIFFFCLKYGLRQEDAEEVVQETFVKLWTSKDRIDPDKSLSSFIFTISKNIIIDNFKKKIKLQAVSVYQMKLLEPKNDVEEIMDYNDLNSTFQKTLNSLPGKRREVFELSRFKGMSHKEISKELGISPKTVENHISLALKNFKQAVQILCLFVLTSIFNF
ncbi:RNA polymerase sigma factor [Algoriphagus aquimarinus]|uniref:RNA polymerase sigma-70 factor, ECF subfamily n=1 Tax=Algoriphagus aquimarinus TaxID=237018 RepID=A0A1I1BRL6_9BACT|nr:RNA polymerase sigma-70 factor [Algoriphagus aquimarinus]SFB52316.1 RNA polymerase sigma-70 factor, ECF subfamily [Algoriphagus aquimarinus]